MVHGLIRKIEKGHLFFYIFFIYLNQDIENQHGRKYFVFVFGIL